MNPLLIRAAVAAAVVAVAFGTGWKVNDWRRDSLDLAVVEAAEKGAQASREASIAAIQGLGKVYVPIKGGVEREIRTEIRYRDCVHTDSAWGLLDKAYQAAGGEPFFGGTGLSDAAPSGGSDVRGDDSRTD
jgi:hypothetical protein